LATVRVPRILMTEVQESEVFQEVSLPKPNRSVVRFHPN
jgi:hypothetical protein